jgi:hypothetical protein
LASQSPTFFELLPKQLGLARRRRAELALQDLYPAEAAQAEPAAASGYWNAVPPQSLKQRFASFYLEGSELLDCELRHAGVS